MAKQTDNPVGRPLKYKSVEEMQVIIDEFFKVAVEGEYTITGIALALGMTRKMLIEYEERGEFRNAVKMAKAKVEHDYEKSLRKNGRAGEIFGLKNFGWKDRYEHDNTGTVTHDHVGISRLHEIFEGFSGSRVDSDGKDTLPN